MSHSRSFKAIILASGKSLTTLVGLVITVVLSRLFTQEDYATYRQAMLSYTFVSPFVILGLNQALFYFLPNEDRRTRGVLVENLLMLSIGGLLLTLFLLLGGNHLLALRFNNPALSIALLLLAPYPLFMVPMTALNACLMARGKVTQVAVYNVLSRLFMLSAVVIPCLMFPTPNVAVLGVVAGAGLASVVGLSMMFRACNQGDWRPSFDGMRRQLYFSVPLGMSTLIATVSRSLDQVFVAAMCSPEVFAVFVNGAMEIPLVGIITGSVTSVLIVDYAKLYKEGRLDEIVRLIHRAMVKCALILIPVMAFLLCMAPELMRFLFGERYEGSAVPFRIYLLLLPMRTLTFGAILMATGNSRMILYQTILGLAVQLSLVWIAVKMFGAIGAAITSVFVLYLVIIPYLLFVVGHILHLPISKLFPWSNLAKVGVASFAPTGAVVVLQYFLPLPDVLALSINGIIYLSLTLTLYSWFGLVSISALYKQFADKFHELVY